MRMIAAAAALMLPALAPAGTWAEEIAQVGVDWIGNDIVIESGLSEGDVVAASAAFLLDAESKLRATGKSEEPAAAGEHRH